MEKTCNTCVRDLEKNHNCDFCIRSVGERIRSRRYKDYWLIKPSLKNGKPVKTDKQRIAELEAALREAIDLTEDTISGSYKPDSFTTQPWKKALEGSE